MVTVEKEFIFSASGEYRTSSEIIKNVRAQIPAYVFQPNVKKLYYIFFHVLAVVIGLFVIRISDLLLVNTAVSFLMGHSLFCIGAAAHSVSHNTVVRNKNLKQFVEVLSWTMVFVSRTVWVVTHNKIHHKHTNTKKDAYLFRYFSESESNIFTKVYSFIFYPNKYIPWNPMTLTTLIPFTFIPTILALFQRNGRGPAYDYYNHNYTIKEKVIIFFELTIMFSWQIGIFLCLGSDLQKYLLGGVLPVFFAICWSMAYINTQHHLHPLVKQHDPLTYTTNVIVPSWVDWLHTNTSYHIEHHLFPGIDTVYYDGIAKIIEEQYPEKYHRIGFFEAWKQLQKNDLLKDDPT